VRSDLKKRINALELALGKDPIVVHLPNGTQRTISPKVEHYFELYEACMVRGRARFKGQPIPKNPLDSELDAVRDAIRIDEPARLYDMLSALLRSPGKSTADSKCEAS
jgi:hypothetical protein